MSVVETTQFTQQCAQRMKALILEQDAEESKAMAIFYDRCLDQYLSIGINLTFYKILPKHSYEYASLLWQFIQFGKPYSITADGSRLSTIDEVTDSIIEQLNEAYGIEEPNFKFLGNLEKSFYAATQILAKEYGAKDLTNRLNFLNSLCECFDHQEEIRS